MKKRIILTESAVYILLISCMVFVCCKTSVEFWYEGTIKYYILFASILLTMVLCMAAYYTKYALLGFALPLLYIIKLIKGLVVVFPAIMRDLYNEGYILGVYHDYFMGVAILCAVVLTIICYFIAVRRKKTAILIIAGAAMYTTYFYYMEENLKLSCSFFMSCGIMLYAFNSYIKKKKYVDKDESINSGSYMLGWLPSILIIMTITMFISPYMPKPVKLKSMSKLENIINNISFEMDAFSARNILGSGSGYFGLSSTGFQQDKKRLGGPVRLSDTPVFTVSSDDKINGMHMRGLVKTYYTGDVWELNDSKDEYEKDKDLGYVPSLSASSREKKITITYKVKGISTIFNALYPLSISIDGDIINGDKDMQLSSPDSIKKNEGYSITIKEFSWDKDRLINAKVDSSKEELKQYLSLPDNISQRVYQLADKITYRYDKPYLKASAIERYLKGNYPYSLDTSKLPENTEFVDHFLFEEKKGSCTYYATAMAVICRIEGLPARYIEGFVVPSGDAKEGIDILNSDAHAWVEVYFDDIGWITFDPTPGHYSNSVDPDAPYESAEEEPEPEITPDRNDEVKVTPTQPQGGQQDGGNSQVEEKESKGWNIPKALWIIIGLVSAGILLRAGIALYYSKGNRRLYYEFFKLTRYGRAVGAAYIPGQSVREYMAAVQKVSGVNLKEFLEYYEKCQYFKSEMLNENIRDEAIRELYKYVIMKNGRVHAWRIRISNPYAYIFKRK